MSDPALALQNAIEAALRDDATLQALFGGTVRLYTLTATLDDRGEARFPHIVIGQDQVIGDDTVCGEASEVSVTVHAYARESRPSETRAKCKAIAGAIRAALTRKLTLVGHVMDDWTFESARHLTDPDGLTAHAVLDFTYLTSADA